LKVGFYIPTYKYFDIIFYLQHMYTEQKGGEDIEKLLEDFTLNESGIGDISNLELTRRDEEIESLKKTNLNQLTSIQAMNESIEYLESQAKINKRNIDNQEENIRNLQNEINDLKRQQKQELINH
jgi:peptidoglycan hydrolase CwlO-like protein